MNVKINSKKIELTIPIKEYIEKKILKLNKYINLIKNINITLSIENKIKNNIEIEILLLNNNVTIIKKSTTTNMYNTIDDGFSKIERQINKYKEINNNFK